MKGYLISMEGEGRETDWETDLLECVNRLEDPHYISDQEIENGKEGKIKDQTDSSAFSDLEVSDVFEHWSKNEKRPTPYS